MKNFLLVFRPLNIIIDYWEGKNPVDLRLLNYNVLTRGLEGMGRGGRDHLHLQAKHKEHSKKLKNK